MSDKLKPCPICGGSAIYKTKSTIDDFLGTQTVSCRECCASSPLHNWNNRPSHDRMVEEIAELKGTLELMILQFESDHNCEYEYKVIKLSKNLLAKLNQEGEE
ncbi:hypothetical protein NVP1122B_64 [Vibrio phage 1.122.B._10N.286.46.F8]|nr:hypothetical protein NVP1122A_64 [Vibrio phage 1.122.A._10N.286.46.F8]AUR89424.1 hypothetical protein NVP1122B_64 [Vibrio phage 1.122.B._10N.286.46.F8]